MSRSAPAAMSRPVAFALAALAIALIFLPGLDAIQRSWTGSGAARTPADADRGCCTSGAPTVQVYSRHPAENGKLNFLNCYVSGFHPPQIEIELLKNGVKIDKVEQSDLSFSKDWSFYLLVHTEFTPNDKDEYSCRVKHVTLNQPMVVKWDRDY